MAMRSGAGIVMRRHAGVIVMTSGHARHALVMGHRFATAVRMPPATAAAPKPTRIKPLLIKDMTKFSD